MCWQSKGIVGPVCNCMCVSVGSEGYRRCGLLFNPSQAIHGLKEKKNQNNGG